MPNAGNIVFGFVLDRIEAEPLTKRAELYRALAQLAASNDERRQFEHLAVQCNRIEIEHAQAKFNFQQRSRRP